MKFSKRSGPLNSISPRGCAILPDVPECPHLGVLLYRHHVGKAMCLACGATVDAPPAPVAPIVPINLDQRRSAK